MNAIRLALAARRIREAVTSEITRLRREAERCGGTRRRVVAGLGRAQDDPAAYAQTCTVIADVLESLLRKAGGEP